MVGEHICKNRVAITKPLTRRNRRGIGRLMVIVLTDAVQDEEQTCKEKPVSELSIVA